MVWEIYYPDWLANTVVVPKKNGKWRVCVDYTNLKKACSKDIFLILRIDQLVYATVGHEMLTFMDAYSGAGTNQLGLQAPPLLSGTYDSRPDLLYKSEASRRLIK